MGGFSIGYGISVRPRLAAFDPDALAYFTTAGITDNTAKTQIDDFVVGIKNLGLWSSMVSWPLRSTQNAGTGTTAYSLGGLGAYNGTLVGSPSWGTEGIALSSLTSISASAPYGTTAGSLFGVTKINSLSKEYAFLRNSPTGMGFFSPYSDNQFYFDYRESTNRLSVSSGITQGQFFCVAGYASASGSQIYRDTTSLATNTTAANGTGSSANLFESFATSSQTAAFGMLLNSDARANHSALYSLYKTTLGQGLGLP